MNTNVKYRPSSLNDFIYPSTALKSVVEMYAEGKTMRPLILHGPHGTGKSLLSELIPKAIDGENVSTKRLSIDDLKSRSDIDKNLTRAAVFDSLTEPDGQSRYYSIFDEFVSDTKVSKDAMRTALDSMEGRGLYIFTTNELNKIDTGIVSRSECVYVPPVAPEDFLPKAVYILKNEGIDVPSDVLLNALIATHKVAADNRRYYKLLDQIIYRAKHQ
jgi:DNA polymerase III delta prime subunit